MALSVLSAGAWAWDKFGAEFVKGVAGAVWERVRWLDKAQAYRKHVQEQYNYIQILGQPKPVPLEGLFTHVIALDEPTAIQRHNVAALQAAAARNPAQFHARMQRDVHRETERLDGLELVHSAEGRRLFILGKPGAGKTTFLKYVAVQAARGDFDRVPIFARLREWQAEGEVLGFLARQFDMCEFPRAAPFLEFLLERTELAVVLFDGLDEIPQGGERRAEAIRALQDFANQYPRAQVLITCRNAASDYTFQGFHYVELADFNQGQIRAFARKWFRVASEVGGRSWEASEVEARFWEAFERKEHRGLRELARQPLLLALLCLAYQETLEFPQRRVDLYAEALDALLKKWNSSKGIRQDEGYQYLAPERKKQLFARLAAGYFEDGVYFFPQGEVAAKIAGYLAGLPPADQRVAVADIDGEAVLKTIEAQHGILTECARGVYTFAHLTFQEYYTARYVVESVASGDFGAIPRLLTHAHEDRWREVIVLTASMLSNAEAFFEVFLARLDAMVKGDPQLVAFLGWVERKTAKVMEAAEPPSYKRAAVRAFYAGLARALDLDRARALDLALALAREAGETALAGALEGLEVPDDEAPDDVWVAFAEELRGIMVEYRDIGHKWEFTWEQAGVLAQYFAAAEVLVACLEVAYVRDREGVEGRLVRKPRK